MALAAAFDSVKVVGTREELSDVIYNLDPFETPIMNSIGKGSCGQKFYEWQVDKLMEGKDSSVPEGHTFDTQDADVTDRMGSTVQINERGFGTTGTMEATKTAGRGSEMAYQMAKVAKALKLDMELALAGGHQQQVRTGQAGTGNGVGTKRKTASVSSFMSQNVIHVDSAKASTLSGDTKLPTTGLTDGQGVWAENAGAATKTITEQHLQELLTGIYTKTGRSPNTLIVDPITKNLVSNTFVGRSTERSMSDKDKTVQSVVDVYVSDFGTLRVMPARQIGKNLTKGGMAFALDTSMWEIKYLRPFNTYTLPKTGDYERKALNVEWGLSCKNEISSGMLLDFKKDYKAS